MPSLASLARDAALATTVLLAAANISPASAQQQMANAGNGGLPTIGNVGQVALEMCQRRGVDQLRMPDCVRDERNRMVQQIGQQARVSADTDTAEAACSRQVVELARDPAIRARGQAILGNQRPSEYGACRLVRALTSG